MGNETSTSEDPDLSPAEKEVTIRGAKDQDLLRVHADLPVVMDYLLDHPAAEIINRREKGGDVVSVIAEIPVGLLTLSNKPRKSSYYSDVVTSSELKGLDDG
jgi:hypothetical protein